MEPQTYLVDEPRPDLILQGVHDIAFANTGEIQFQGSSLWEFPDPALYVDRTPYLVVLDPEHVNYSVGGSPTGELTERAGTALEPNWDVEAFAIWQHSLDDPHFSDVSRCKGRMLRTWIQHPDLGPDVPTCWFTQPYGFQKRYVFYDDRKQVAWIACRWVVRCIEQLLITQTAPWG